ncbi:MAG: VPDSG-CTERM sorting domain-containing protein [Verrucomicrobiota bacterium]|jgi:hypothetical protein
MKSTKIILALVAAGAAVALTQQANAQYTLQGNYLEVGVGADGSIINPAGTAPTIGGQYYSQYPGIIWNGAGTGFGGSYVNNDFITPGTPYQSYSIGVGGNYGVASYIAGTGTLGTTTTQTGPLSTLTTGSFGGLTFSQTLSFTAGSSIINYAMTLNNPTGAALNNVVFNTALDPDPDVYQFGSYVTANTIVSPGIVQATGLDTHNSIIIQGVTPGAAASIISDWYSSTIDPYSHLTSENDGTPADYAIEDSWDIGTLAAGASETIDYNYIINATPVTSTSTILGPPSAPDGGSTLGLLGLALTGFGLIRRKMKV